jgi:dTDP-glucose 4,6-dehydratase
VTFKNIEHPSLEDFEFFINDGAILHVVGELDFILHFVSPASPIDYLKYSDLFKSGSARTHNLLGLAKAKTSFTYRFNLRNLWRPHHQTEECYGNVNTIGTAELTTRQNVSQESMTMAYRFHGLETRIVRIFTTLCPRMRPKLMVVIPALQPLW